MNCLIEEIEEIEEIDFHSAPIVDAMIVDGPALAQMNTPKVSSTFGKYCDREIGQKVKSIAQTERRIDVVFDVYKKDLRKRETQEVCGKNDGVRIAVERQPVVKQHDGKGIALSIKDGLDTFGIKGEKHEGSSHDGQYSHLSVPTYLHSLYDLTESFFSTTVPLHLAGTTDVHMRKDPSFQWMVKLFLTCKDLYNKFNWERITSFL